MDKNCPISGKKETKMYKSATYGDLDLERVPEKIKDYYEKMKKYDAPIKLTIGSDSQTFDTLKLVNVIAVICEGHGAYFSTKSQGCNGQMMSGKN